MRKTYVAPMSSSLPVTRLTLWALVTYSAAATFGCHSEPSYDTRTAHEWIDSMGSVSLRERVHAANALGRILEISPNSPHVIQALITALYDEDPVRMAAAAALSAEGLQAPGALQGLHRALHDSAHADVRAAAASVLGSVGGDANAGTVAVLTEALRDGDARVRASAAEALGGIGPRAAEALTALDGLTSDPSPFVRIGAMQAFIRVSRSQQRALPMLHAMMKDASPDVRAQAMYSVAEFGSGASVLVPELVARLADSAAVVRRAATYALRMVGPNTPSASLNPN